MLIVVESEALPVELRFVSGGAVLACGHAGDRVSFVLEGHPYAIDLGQAAPKVTVTEPGSKKMETRLWQVPLTLRRSAASSRSRRACSD